jgi:hypothetical protein
MKRTLDYWSGLQTDDPIFEVVVQGQVYFPDWGTFPPLVANISSSP